MCIRDRNGHGKAVSDLPMGSYYVQEINTNAAYLKNETKYPVVFEYAGQETAVVSITANEGEAIENDLIYGDVYKRQILARFPLTSLMTGMEMPCAITPVQCLTVIPQAEQAVTSTVCM